MPSDRNVKVTTKTNKENEIKIENHIKNTIIYINKYKINVITK